MIYQPEENLIPVGKIVKAKGLKGQVKVLAYSREPTALLAATRFFLRTKLGASRVMTPLQVIPERDGARIAFKEVSTKDEAQELVGASVLVKKDELPPLGEDEFYWFQLIGLKVYTRSGEYLGVVEEMIPTGSNDVLVVRDGEKERLLPAIADVVDRVELDSGQMRVNLVEGLEDDEN